MNYKFFIWLGVCFLCLCLFIFLGITYLDMTTGFSPNNYSIGVITGLLSVISCGVLWLIWQ